MLLLFAASVLASPICSGSFTATPASAGNTLRLCRHVDSNSFDAFYTGPYAQSLSTINVKLELDNVNVPIEATMKCSGRSCKANVPIVLDIGVEDITTMIVSVYRVENPKYTLKFNVSRF
jgi:hypothetical protein